MYVILHAQHPDWTYLTSFPLLILGQFSVHESFPHKQSVQLCAIGNRRPRQRFLKNHRHHKTKAQNTSVQSCTSKPFALSLSTCKHHPCIYLLLVQPCSLLYLGSLVAPVIISSSGLLNPIPSSCSQHLQLLVLTLHGPMMLAPALPFRLTFTITSPCPHPGSCTPALLLL